VRSQFGGLQIDPPVCANSDRNVSQPTMTRAFA